jgi:predicted pyridoxine 5'-phosphate oxidase superfamily flavin-nucleotide-binding protein
MNKATGFHAGELAVQTQAGVRAQAARLVSMLDPADLDGGAGRFLAERDFAVLAGRDNSGRLWASPLTGKPGFLAGHGTNLRISAALTPPDPLAGLPSAQPVGLIAIDFGTRRRLRVNGNLIAAGARGLEVDVEQAFGNCPQFIQQRSLVPNPTSRSAQVEAAEYVSSEFTPDQRALIARADTFFLGTTHPERGTDASHRGGPPGFVRVERSSLWWPDYAGNNMFNSLGNLATDPTAALLFLDFSTGATLHLSGTARLEWTTPEEDGDDAGTGRRVLCPQPDNSRCSAPDLAGPRHPCRQSSG